jgi:hypothetical protein
MLNRSWVVEESEKNMNTKMFAISALCATVAITASAAEIVSSDVVGYKIDSSMRRGNSLIAPSFLSTSGSAASVTDLDVGNLGEFVNGEVNFQSLDAYGRMEEGSSYVYLGYEGMTGWYDGDFAEASKTFTPCEAVWLALPGEESSAISPVSLTDSGKVNADDVILTLRQGNTAIGNMMAVDYPIADIEVGNVGEQINGEINFQSLDAYGRMEEGSSFVYLGYEGMTGWFDGDFSPATTSIKSGDGVWFATTAPGVTLKFYAPDL